MKIRTILTFLLSLALLADPGLAQAIISGKATTRHPSHPFNHQALMPFLKTVAGPFNHGDLFRNAKSLIRAPRDHKNEATDSIKINPLLLYKKPSLPKIPMGPITPAWYLLTLLQPSFGWADEQIHRWRFHVIKVEILSLSLVTVMLNPAMAIDTLFVYTLFHIYAIWKNNKKKFTDEYPFDFFDEFSLGLSSGLFGLYVLVVLSKTFILLAPIAIVHQLFARTPSSESFWSEAPPPGSPIYSSRLWDILYTELRKISLNVLMIILLVIGNLSWVGGFLKYGSDIPEGRESISQMSTPSSSKNVYEHSPQKTTEQKLQDITQSYPDEDLSSHLASGDPRSGILPQDGIVARLRGRGGNEVFITGSYNTMENGGRFNRKGKIRRIPQGKPVAEDLEVEGFVTLKRGERRRLMFTPNTEPVASETAGKPYRITQDGFVEARADLSKEKLTYHLQRFPENHQIEAEQPITNWLKQEFLDIPAPVREILDRAKGGTGQQKASAVRTVLELFTSYSAQHNLQLKEGTWNAFLQEKSIDRKIPLQADCDVLASLAYIYFRYLDVDSIFILGYWNQGGSTLRTSTRHGTLLIHTPQGYMIFESTRFAQAIVRRETGTSSSQNSEQRVEPVSTNDFMASSDHPQGAVVPEKMDVPAPDMSGIEKMPAAEKSHEAQSAKSSKTLPESTPPHTEIGNSPKNWLDSLSESWVFLLATAALVLIRFRPTRSARTESPKSTDTPQRYAEINNLIIYGSLGQLVPGIVLAGFMASSILLKASFLIGLAGGLALIVNAILKIISQPSTPTARQTQTAA